MQTGLKRGLINSMFATWNYTTQLCLIINRARIFRRRTVRREKQMLVSVRLGSVKFFFSDDDLSVLRRTVLRRKVLESLHIYVDYPNTDNRVNGLVSWKSSFYNKKH